MTWDSGVSGPANDLGACLASGLRVQAALGAWRVQGLGPGSWVFGTWELGLGSKVVP